MCLIVVAIMIPWTVVLAGKMPIDACVMNEGPGYFRGNAKMIRMFIFIAYIQVSKLIPSLQPAIRPSSTPTIRESERTFRP